VDANLTLTYEQEMPYRGKRRLSGEVAAAEVDVARSELELDRRALREQVILAYLDVLRADRTRAIVEASREVLSTLLSSARARYEAGQGVLEDLLKTQTEITRIEIETADLDQERASAASRLNAAVGRAPDTPIPALSTVPEVAVPAADAVLAAASSSPSVERMRRMEAVSAARLESAKLASKPDWLWGVSWAERGSLDPMVMGMVGARLPLWRKNKQLQEAAAAESDLAPHAPPARPRPSPPPVR
jgi:outer membrane protein TolC